MKDKIENMLVTFLAASVITAPVTIGIHVLKYLITIITL